MDILRESDAYQIFPTFQSGQTPEAVVNGQKVILTGSNNYLGLATHPKVLAAVKVALYKYGTGCGGSRWLNGNSHLHRELEHRLAGFLGYEAALVSTTGYQSNIGVMTSLVGRKEVVILDKLDHASIIDGCRLSLGKMVRYRHNDMGDLERCLKRYKDQSIMVVVDGVYSMEGDLTDLPEVVNLSKRYNARLIVDDAHGVGVMGSTGRGTVEHFGLEGEVDLVMISFAKAFGGIGGAVVGESRVIDWIQHASRPQMFSTAMPPGVAAGLIAAIDVMETEPEWRELLWQNRNHLVKSLRSLGYDTGQSSSHIIPIIIGEESLMLDLVKMLNDFGIYCNPISNPAVPLGRSMIRMSVMATHSKDQINKIIEAFDTAGNRLGII